MSALRLTEESKPLLASLGYDGFTLTVSSKSLYLTTTCGKQLVIIPSVQLQSNTIAKRDISLVLDLAKTWIEVNKAKLDELVSYHKELKDFSIALYKEYESDTKPNTFIYINSNVNFNIRIKGDTGYSIISVTFLHNNDNKLRITSINLSSNSHCTREELDSLLARVYQVTPEAISLLAKWNKFSKAQDSINKLAAELNTCR